jgi:hypothetical protein
MELIPQTPLRRIVLVAAMLVMPSPGGVLQAADALDVRISPRVALEPATLRITVDIEPEADNRYVVIQVESDAFSRSSLIQLDGLDSAKRHDVRYQELPAGEYVHRRDVIRFDWHSRVRTTRRDGRADPRADATVDGARIFLASGPRLGYAPRLNSHGWGECEPPGGWPASSLACSPLWR